MKMLSHIRQGEGMKTSAVVLFLLGLASAAAAQDQQVGARTKAMGGSYTAFEDDPISIWLNPAGIATQPDAATIAYQTFTAYELTLSSAVFAGNDPEALPRMSWADPAIIPSYLGTVIQVGTPEAPQAFGFFFASPYQLHVTFSSISDTDVPNMTVDQAYYRFRAAYACDLRFKPPGSEGAFTHLALGAGLDFSVAKVKFKELGPDAFPPPVALALDLTDTGFGGGAGLLLGVYDNTRDFKMNLGLAWQSQIHYDFSVTSAIAPLFHWPNQYQAGLTAYLLDGLPLRVTADAQLIQWDRATDDSEVP